MNHFFVSYNRNDREWAEWIAWQLEAQGYTTVIQAWDFRPGGNFVLDMQEAALKAQTTIAVLSPAYLESRFTAPEWAAAFARDPTGSKRILLPVRVRECEPTGLLAQIVYIDLVGLDEQNAKERLLQGVKSERASAPRRYPGGHVPVFPGESAADEVAHAVLMHRRSAAPAVSMPTRTYNITRQPSHLFFGRDAAMTELRNLLRNGDTAIVPALNGLPGIGKTELARHLVAALTKEGAFPGGIFWIDAEQSLTAQWGGPIAADLSGVTAPSDETRCQQVLELLHKSRQDLLVVLDNVEVSGGALLPGPLPQGQHVRMLVTSRKELSPAEFANFRVEMLADDAARDLLGKLAGPWLAEDAGLPALLTDLGGYTLAVELAGVYLHKRHVKAGEYLRLLREGRKPGDSMAGQVRYKRSVDDAMRLVWKAVSSVARAAWQVLALFAAAPIGREVADACGANEDAVAVLREWRIIEDDEADRYVLHRVVRAFGREAGSKSARDAARKRFLEAWLKRADAAELDPDAVHYANDLPHVDEVAALLRATADAADASTVPSSEDPRRLLPRWYRCMAGPAQRLAALGQACHLAENAVVHMRSLTGHWPECAELKDELVGYLLHLGNVSRDLGKWAASRKYYEEARNLALVLANATPADDHRSYTAALANFELGRALPHTGERQLGLATLEAALLGFAAVCSRQSAELQWSRQWTVCMDELGRCKLEDGDFSAAATHFNDRFAKSQWLHTERPGNADYLRDFAIANQRLGELALHRADNSSALCHFRQSLNLFEQLNNRPDPVPRYAVELAGRCLSVADCSPTEAACQFAHAGQLLQGVPASIFDHTFCRDVLAAYNARAPTHNVPLITPNREKS